MSAFFKPITYTVLVGLVFLLGLMSTQSFAGKMDHHKTGQFVGARGHNAEGSVELQGRTLVLSNIDIDRVPDGRVYLTNDAEYESGIELGKLTKFSGNVKYSIPTQVNTEAYNSVLIWCKKFSVEIGHADIKAVMK